MQGERLESQHLARVLVRHESETVPDEQEVELSSFARVGDRLENRKVLAAGSGSRKPPARHMIPRSHGVYAVRTGNHVSGWRFPGAADEDFAIFKTMPTRASEESSTSPVRRGRLSCRHPGQMLRFEPLDFARCPGDADNAKYDLLVFLIKNKNTILSREMLLNQVWGFNVVVNPNVVDLYIGYVRKKLKCRRKTGIFKRYMAGAIR